MAGEPTDATPVVADRGIDLQRWLLILAPLVALLLVVGLLLAFPPFAGIQTGEPLPDVAVTHATMPGEETIVLHVTNNGPAAQTVEQVLVNDAYWSFTAGDGGANARKLGALERTTIEIPYHWNPGWDVEIALVLSSGATVHHTIVAPQPTPGLTTGLLGELALVGVLVGIVPIVLGMFWYPVLRDLDASWLHGVLAFAGGVLGFLAVDAGVEALAVAGEIPGALDGTLLVVLGVVGTLLVIQGVTEYFDDGELRPLGIAYLVALSIGLHNLAEGLAIGGAVALGRVSLGAFLVIGFVIHNVTEGPAVVAPVARGRRPKLRHFAAMGLLAGAPVILGGWIGSAVLGPTPGALFLAIGVGAILQVEWEVGSMIRREGDLVTVHTIGGFLVGLVAMYLTDLVVAL